MKDPLDRSQANVIVKRVVASADGSSVDNLKDQMTREQASEMASGYYRHKTEDDGLIADLLRA